MGHTQSKHPNSASERVIGPFRTRNDGFIDAKEDESSTGVKDPVRIQRRSSPPAKSLSRGATVNWNVGPAVYVPSSDIFRIRGAVRKEDGWTGDCVTALYLDGGAYVGMMRSSLRWGFGVYIGPLGEQYEGEWREDKQHGGGKWTRPNGSSYTGSFEHGKKHGVGAFRSSLNGLCYVEVWDDGLLKKQSVLRETDGGLASAGLSSRFLEVNERFDSRTSLHSPSQGKSVLEWTVDEVAMWLHRVGCGDIGTEFRGAHITGRDLLALSVEDLHKNLGIRALGKAIKLRASIDQLADLVIKQQPRRGKGPSVDPTATLLSSVGGIWPETPNVVGAKGFPLSGLFPSASSGSLSGHPHPSEYETWVIDFNELKFESRLTLKDEGGERGFICRVYKASWLGKDVAVRVYRSSEGADFNKWREAVERLARLRHPNLSMFMGVAVHHPLYCIITEFSGLGSLHDALLSSSPPPPSKSAAALRPPLSPGTSLHIVRSICLACKYLSEQGVCHLNLSPRNVLFDSNLELKLADYGLKMVEDSFLEDVQAVGGETLTTKYRFPAWQAPEALRKWVPQRPLFGENSKSDVYQIGALLWTMFTGKEPFEGRSSDMQLKAIIGYSGSRIPLPPLAPPTPRSIRKLVDKCLNRTLGLRPSFSELLLLIDDANADSNSPAILELSAFLQGE